MSSYNGILIYGEVMNGEITTITRELINIGRRIGDNLNQPTGMLLLGKDIQESVKEVTALDIDRVYIVEASQFIECHPGLYTSIITKVCQQTMPSIILFGHTDMGRDVAPRLAARLGATVTMDCNDIAIDPRTRHVLQTKMAYGGNAMAIWVAESPIPQIVTLRPRSVMNAESPTSRRAEIINLNINIDPSNIKSKLLKTVKEEIKGTRLEEAKVIVSGGGGIGSREGFKLLEELAQVLGGTVGITRVPYDEGWMAGSLEIGQTGRVVDPNLYIAIGISGAPQHMAGVSSSKCIVAINKDPDAHIFKEADFGVVGDYKEILPPLIEKCKALIT